MAIKSLPTYTNYYEIVWGRVEARTKFGNNFEFIIRDSIVIKCLKIPKDRGLSRSPSR